MTTINKPYAQIQNLIQMKEDHKIQRRKNQEKAIMHENKQLIKRIFDQKGSLSRKKFERDFDASRNYAAIRQNFKPQKDQFHLPGIPSVYNQYLNSE